VKVIVIDNFLSKEDFELVREEIKANGHLITRVPDNTTISQYRRWFVDNTYENRRNDSNILKIMEMGLFGGKFAKECAKYHEAPWVHLLQTSKHETQVTKYMKGQQYGWHNDNKSGRLINYILYINDSFKGGELAVSYTTKRHVDKLISPKSNRLVAIPSFYWHKVKPINEGNRYTVNGHIGMILN